jgi:hypothetical protein
MKRRVAAKLVLLVLADHATPNGENAWPSEKTIATKTELGVRTVRKVLNDLQAYKFIAEQRRPSNHRPRTWRLILERLSGSDADTDAVCEVAGLTPDPAADRQEQAHGRQNNGLGRQNGTSDRHGSADDPFFERSIKREDEPQGSGAAAPRISTEKTPDELKGDFQRAKVLATEVLNGNPPDASFDSLLPKLIEAGAGSGIDQQHLAGALVLVMSKRRFT